MSGMKSNAELPKVSYLSKLFEECRKHGVVKLSIDGIGVEFSTPLAFMPVSEKIPQKITKIHDEAEQRVIEEDELFLRQQELDEALVENPQLWEELSQKGDLDAKDEYSGFEPTLYRG